MPKSRKPSLGETIWIFAVAIVVTAVMGYNCVLLGQVYLSKGDNTRNSAPAPKPKAILPWR